MQMRRILNKIGDLSYYMNQKIPRSCTAYLVEGSEYGQSKELVGNAGF